MGLRTTSLPSVWPIERGVRADRRLAPGALRVAPRIALAGACALAMALVPLPALAQLALAVAVYVGMIALLRALPRELLELVPGHPAWVRRA